MMQGRVKPMLKGYQIIKPLGKGGNGLVYLAKHLATDRLVAIKEMKNQNNVLRFKNEARLQANLNHPQIAKLYDFIYTNGYYYIIMEYVGGITLKNYLKKVGKVNQVKARAIFLQIVKAVAYLHKKKIIHRDLKPSNIKIIKDGKIKLIDFGISKGLSTPLLTKVGHMVGTPHYAAPERFSGVSDFQSDVWSLGAIYYELIHGMPLLEANSTSIALSRVNNPEYFRNKVQSVTGFSGKIMRKCLAYSYKNRYRNAVELLEAIHDKQRSLELTSSVTNYSIGLPSKKLLLLIPLLLIAGYLFWHNNDKSMIRNQGNHTIELSLFPQDAVINIQSKGTFRHGDKINGNPGQRLEGIMKAKGYQSNKVYLTFSEIKPIETLQYSLRK